MNWLFSLRPKCRDDGRDGAGSALGGEAKEPGAGLEPNPVDDDARIEGGSLGEVTPTQPAEAEADRPMPEVSAQPTAEAPAQPAAEAELAPHSWLAREKLVAAILVSLGLFAGAVVVVLGLIQDTRHGAVGPSVPVLSTRSIPAVEGATPGIDAGIAPGMADGAAAGDLWEHPEYPEIPSETPETGIEDALGRLDGQGEGSATSPEKTTPGTDGNALAAGVAAGAAAGAGGAAEADNSRGARGVTGAGSTAGVVTGTSAALPNSSANRSTYSAQSAPRLAVVIDDWGYDWPAARQILALKVPLTAAILPFAPLTHEQAELARQAGFDVILHMPMEPFDSSISLSAETVRTNMAEDTIKELVRRALRAVPQAVGVSNHQGSRATSDSRIMRAVLEVVRQEGLFFLDSRTSNQSVAVTVARQLGVPAVANRVFIDNDDDVAAIEARLWEAVELARREGQAIAIGHVHRSTAIALARTLPEIQKAGIELVTVSSLIGAPGRQAVTRPVSMSTTTPVVPSSASSAFSVPTPSSASPASSVRSASSGAGEDSDTSAGKVQVQPPSVDRTDTQSQSQMPSYQKPNEDQDQTEASSQNGVPGMSGENTTSGSDSPVKAERQLSESEAVEDGAGS